MEFMAALRDMIKENGVDYILEEVGMICLDMAAVDEELPEEEGRKWRTRGSGVSHALRLYQEFVKERDAA